MIVPSAEVRRPNMAHSLEQFQTDLGHFLILEIMFCACHAQGTWQQAEWNYCIGWCAAQYY
jgi:hypothetical protein